MSTKTFLSSTLGQGGPSVEDEWDITKEEIYDVLSNRRRCCALQYMQRQNGDSVNVRNIVDYVTYCEYGADMEDVGYRERKRVYTALRQSHLPKLHELGIIEYDTVRGEATLTDDAERVQMYLEYVPENDIPWHSYYMGLTAVCAALVATVGAGIYPFGGVSWFALTAILVTLFGISAVVHAYHARQNRLVNADIYPDVEE